MIKNTFCHISGISQNTEKILWENQIYSWDDFLEEFDNIKCIPQSKLNKIKTDILISQEHLKNNNLNYFKNNLPNKEHFRLVNKGKIAFLDIETTGLSKYSHEITLIGIYDGQNPHIYINGQNLDKAYEHLKQFDIIVTFNGKTFDIPFIEYNANTKYDIIHLDLRYLLKEFGYSGGLKNIEKALGIKRNDEVEDIDGFEAIRLWKKYLRGDKNALRKLLKYNQEDIINLKYLLEFYLNQKQKELEVCIPPKETLIEH